MSGLGAGANGAAGIPLGPGIWEAGGWWDFSLLNVAQGATMTTPIPALVGALSYTPTWSVNPPTYSKFALGGRGAIKTAFADGSYLRSDGVATLMSGLNTPWTIVARVRSTDPTHPTQPVWGAGSSAQSTHDFCRMSIVAAPQNILLERDTAATGHFSYSSAESVQFNDVVLVSVFDGTNVSNYINGVLSSISAQPFATTSIPLNRFALCAFLSTAASSLFTGYVQSFGFTPQALSATQIVQLTSDILAADYVFEPANCLQLLPCGDSITQGDAGNNGGGFLFPLSNFFIDNQASWIMVGDRQQGWYPNRDRSATGGFQLSQIQTEALSCIGTGGRTNIRLGTLLGGTNNLLIGTTADQVLAYRTCHDAIQNAAIALQSTFRLLVSPVPPIKSTNAASPFVNPYNAGIIQVWDDWDLAHPSNKVIRADFFTAMGGVWNSTLFFDDVHPNTAGDNAIAANIISVAGPLILSLSPTRLAA